MGISACFKGFLDSERTFSIYGQCVNVETVGKITRYNGVSSFLGCFLKQFDSLSKDCATCIPKASEETFLKCMNESKTTFPAYVTEKYKRTTIFFNDNTLVKAFEDKLLACTEATKTSDIPASTPVVAGDSIGSSFAGNTTIYVVTALVVLSATAVVWWRLSQQNKAPVQKNQAVQ